MLKFYYKVANNSLPASFKYLRFTPAKATNNHNLRWKRLLKLPKAKTKLAKGHSNFRIAKTVNDTCTAITDKITTHSPDSFSKYIKTMFLSKYVSNCTKTKCYICKKVPRRIP